MIEEGLAVLELEEYEDTDEVEVNEDDLLEEENALVWDPNRTYSKRELEELADQMLKDDANREVCRRCKEDGDPLSYGEETGIVESVPQYVEGEPFLDEEDQQLYLDFPELECKRGHKWYKGEGPRRDIRGKDPILFESHLYQRKRREIYVAAGTPDPAYTMDRFGKPTKGSYNRVHPDGRKVNSKEQRSKHGASFYR